MILKSSLILRFLGLFNEHCRLGVIGIAISNMTFSPYWLVHFHSRVMTLLPGDVISTGTPGAVVIEDGDLAECRISGFEPLSNPVVRHPRENRAL